MENGELKALDYLLNYALAASFLTQTSLVLVYIRIATHDLSIIISLL